MEPAVGDLIAPEVQAPPTRLNPGCRAATDKYHRPDVSSAARIQAAGIDADPIICGRLEGVQVAWQDKVGRHRSRSPRCLNGDPDTVGGVEPHLEDVLLG